MRVLIATNMYPTPERPVTGSFVKDQVEALRAQGVSVDVFVAHGAASSWNYLWAVGRLWWYLLWHGRQYDLMHAHYVLMGIIARAQWALPVVLTHHGCEVLGYPRWQTWLAKIVTPLFDEVIYVSEQMRRALSDEDGWVIPCGVDPDQFAPIPRDDARARLGLDSETPLVLWASDPQRPEKCFALAEQAMALVATEVPGAQLHLLTGQPHESVPLHMSACDALLLTSHLEGSPVVTKEAMACNLPIVSVRVGDVPETIGGTPGCAIVERTPEAIAAQLVRVLRTQQRTDGRSRIDHLRHDQIAGRIVDVYEHLLGRSRATVRGDQHGQALSPDA